MRFDLPPIGVWHDHDGSAQCPLPVGTDYTVELGNGKHQPVPFREVLGTAPRKWMSVRRYLVHSYPENHDVDYDWRGLARSTQSSWLNSVCSTGLDHAEADQAAAAHTKALLDGAGELVERLGAIAEECQLSGTFTDFATDFTQAAATIAAQAAEIERLNARGPYMRVDPAAIMPQSGGIAATDIEWRTAFGTLRDAPTFEVTFGPVFTPAAIARAKEDGGD